MTVPISAVLITFNSERVLPEVLRSLVWCDEVVVVDSGSTDCTLAIARRFDCHVIHHDFEGFGRQKGFAVSQASNDWVLVVDADEVVTPELCYEIRQRVGRDKAVGFEVPISLVFLGKLMRYGREYKMPHLRLFNRQYGNYNDNQVHEDVILNGPVARLQNHMLHYSYGSLHEYFEKFNRYTTAGARDLARRKKKGALYQIVFRLPITFLKEYCLKLNFLNGYPGFLWSMLSAMYPVVKYAKLREMQEQE